MRHPQPDTRRQHPESVPSACDVDAVAALDTQPVSARSMPTSPTSAEQVRTSEWTLDELWLPAVVLHDTALRHNLDRFAAWCAASGVRHAPHGKTTMSPQLWSAQLARGAWGLTAATTAQARVMHSYGVSRVVIANEVVSPPDLAWLAGTTADPDSEVLCVVDSLEGVTLMERHLAHAAKPLPVLVELGVAGRRTGVRDTTEALNLAERVAASGKLHLAGVEGYEGVLPQRRDGSAPEDARAWLERLTEFAVAADKRDVFTETERVLVTAGGSAFPDLAAEALRGMPELSRPIIPIVRSGCYLTHDDLSYERNSPLRSTADADPLRPALSCFARVVSCPEHGRAILGVGKRDVAFDIDLPVVRARRREGVRLPITGQARITELNDHHGFCDVETGLLEVGDIVELGLSHPCTVFDKWPLIPVVDENDRVIDAVNTLF